MSGTQRELSVNVLVLPTLIFHTIIVRREKGVITRNISRPMDGFFRPIRDSATPLEIVS